MHLLSIFVLAVISTGGATAVAEEPLISLQDAAPGLLTFNSGKQDGNAKDGAAMMANPDSDLVVDAACSPSSNQPRRQGKIRRGGICTPDGQSRASPLQGQHEEQPIAPYQMAPAEETPNDSSAASDDGSGGPICNPLIVGLNRQVAVCDNGRAINRILNINVRMPTIWPIGPTYSRGSYTIEDVSSCKSYLIVAWEFEVGVLNMSDSES